MLKFKSKNPTILFASGDNRVLNLYFKDDDMYVKVVLSPTKPYFSRTYNWLEEFKTSHDFNFSIDCREQFFVLDDKKLEYKKVKYIKDYTSGIIEETNLYQITTDGCSLSDKIKLVSLPELIDSLEDENVKNYLLENKDFKKIEEYTREVFQLLEE